MARATEAWFPCYPLNGQIGASKQQVARCSHTPLQNVPVGRHAHTLAKRALEVADAQARQAGSTKEPVLGPVCSRRLVGGQNSGGQGVNEDKGIHRCGERNQHLGGDVSVHGPLH
jgi:hypothetical protein